MSEPTAGTNFTWRQLVVVVLVIVLAWIVVLAPMFQKGREKSRRLWCAGNLKSLGLALLMYTGDNGGFFPIANAPGGSNLEPLNTIAFLANGKIYACPSASFELTMAERTNYRYRGSGLMDDNAAATAITVVYDTSGNHPRNRWMNAVFIDGHVEGALPDGTKSNIIPAVPPSSPAIIVGPWNLTH